MDFIKGKENGQIYMYSFWASLVAMLAGPALFFVTLLFWMAVKNPSATFSMEYLMSEEFMKASMITEVLGDILPFALIGVFLKKMLVSDAQNWKKNWLKYILVVIASVIAIYFLSYFLTIIYEALKIEGTSQNQAVIEEIVKSDYRPVMFVMVIITGPIMEEFIFRKFLIGYLEDHKKVRPWVAFLISSVSFAAIHVITSPQDLIFLPQYLVLACTITLSYKLTNNNIYVSSLVHIANNILAFYAI